MEFLVLHKLYSLMSHVDSIVKLLQEYSNFPRTKAFFDQLCSVLFDSRK